MKIESVQANRRKREFLVSTAGGTYSLPFAKCDPAPSAGDGVVRVYVDPELGMEGITYALRSGAEGSVHLDAFLDYNMDPDFMRDTVLYRLSVEAQERLKASGLSKREVIRRLGTSASQLYRLLDQTNYDKSIDAMLRLLQVLHCEVEFVVRER